MKKLLKAAFISIFIMGILISCKQNGGDLLPPQGVHGSRNAVVFLGDSITEGYGLSEGEDYPSLIQNYWDNNNIAFRSVNEGISGNTTGDIINRLDNVLTDDTYFVFVEIGANDVFRGYEIDEIKRNLTQIIKNIQSKNIKVAIMGMEIPKGLPGIRKSYLKEFAGIYDDIGDELNVPVMPSLLESTSRENGLMQSDAIHPSADGQKLLAKNILKFLNEDWIQK